MVNKLKSSLTVALVLLVCSAFDCLAFKVLTTPSGEKLKWDGASMSYYFNSLNAPIGAASAIQSAAQTWTDVESSDFVFSYLGPTDTQLPPGVRTNVIDFGALSDTVTLAETRYLYNPQTGEMLENDIRFNTYFAWATNGSPTAFDVQNIATHEFGHCLGLEDLRSSDDKEKTMYYSSPSGEQSKRILHSDDIAGISYLYPSIYIESWLTVTLGPAEAVSAGAQWRVDAGEWRNSGDTAGGLYGGRHSIEFSALEGWISPAARTVTINSGETKSFTAAYSQKPDLTITAVKDGSENKKDFPQFRVTRANGDNTKKLVVTYSVDPSAEDSATMGKDYKKLKGKVTIRAKSNDAFITVKPKNDKTPEGPETVTIALTPGQSSNAENQTATVYIYDND